MDSFFLLDVDCVFFYAVLCVPPAFGVFFVPKRTLYPNSEGCKQLTAKKHQQKVTTYMGAGTTMSLPPEYCTIQLSPYLVRHSVLIYFFGTSLVTVAFWSSCKMPSAHDSSRRYLQTLSCGMHNRRLYNPCLHWYIVPESIGLHKG